MTYYRLRRSLLERVFGGVCGGIGASVGISGWWVRLMFIALTAVSPSFGILTYVLLWVLIPAQSLTDLPPIAPPGEPPAPRFSHPEGVLLTGVGAIVIGVIVLVYSSGLISAPKGDLIAPVMLLLIGVIVLFKQIGRLA